MRPLPLSEASDEALFGGKSVQLGASLRAGLPVPRGWALSVEFVEAFVRNERSVHETLKQLLSDSPDPFAVRSSGVGEDAAIASFAGQHFTELNCLGYEGIANGIRAVWESGHSEGAKAYRAKLGIAAAPRTAVTLQEMVFPDCAGVMFTRHPLTGADEIVIEAAWGLGESIVEGLVIPDHFRLGKDGTLKEKRAGIKDLMMRARPGGGVEEVPISEPDRISGLCLDDARLAALVSLGVQCEAHFGPGRDIEWGVAGGTLYLLQCRAITIGMPA